jgi:hypothetical protein
MVRLLIIAVLATFLTASPAAAAPTWLAPQNLETGLADPQPSSGRGDVVVTPSGKAVAVWIARVAGVDRAHARVRLPGQGFGPRITFTPANGSNAASIHAAADAAGNVTVAWQEQQGPGGIEAIRTARLPAGAQSFEPATTVSNVALRSTAPVIDVGASGVAVIAYTQLELGMQRLVAVVRNAPGVAFGGRQNVSPEFAPANVQPVVGVDDDGDAVAAWVRNTGGHKVIEANSRPRTGGFGDPQTSAEQLSNPILDADHPALAIAPNGTAVVLWNQLGPQNDIRYNERTPGNVWLMDPKIASQPGTTAFGPAVAMDGAGNAVAVWNASRGAGLFVQAALRFAGGAFGGAYRDLTTVGAFQLDVASNRAGDSIITFNDSMGDLIGSVRRPRNGEFSGVIPAERQATDSTQMINGAVGIDDQGNATGLWFRNIVNPGNTHDVAVGAFDAAPPTLVASVPSGGTAGQAIAMAAAATDRLSPVAVKWAFGDGGTAAGGAVSHAFGSAGAFTVSVTATDAVGNATAVRRPVLVSPAAPPPPPPPPLRITSKVKISWGVNSTRTFLIKLKIPKVPKGGKAQLTCKGKKCPFKKVSSKKRRKGTITLFRNVKLSKVQTMKKRTFRPGQRVELRITAPGYIGKVVRYQLKRDKIPVGKELCLPVGAKKPRSTCG